MALGGYKIIDLKHTNLVVDGSAVTIKGLYESIEGNYHKATLLSNITINGIERNDRYVVFGINGQNFDANIAISGDIGVLILRVTPEDKVTLIEN